MEWMLIPLFLAFIAAGFWWMKGLDRFLDRQKKHAPKKADSKQVVLLFGGTDSAKEMEKILSFKKIPYLHVSKEFEIDRGLVYHYLFALSDDDLDNIMMCRIGERIFGVPEGNMVSLCNSTEHRKIFEEKGIPYQMRGSDLAAMFTNYQGETGDA
ncbi:MAG TPA: hypothetical protein PLU82_04535 [Oscillospiraceae bacterium]|nr:hypothetical protein [Oscillospiraceae bacterium]